jgi:tRNA pseudouridine38-40 synthase
MHYFPKNRIKKQRTIACKVYYDGTPFYGFQFQKDRRTVSGEILRALLKSKLVPNTPSAAFQAASRTDRGASALGQTVVFKTDQPFTVQRLNAHLPPEIRAWALADVPSTFNPRREAIERHYLYIQPDRHEDITSMRQAAQLIVEMYSFGEYWKNGCSAPRKLKRLKISRRAGHLYFNFYAKSFTRGLVRRLVGLLLRIGEGKVEVSFSREDVERAVIKAPLAPAENLILLDVKYKVKFQVDESARRILLDRLGQEVAEAEVKRVCLHRFYSQQHKS